MGAAKQFTKEQKQQIEQAIKTAELNTSGEIRVHIEPLCKIEALDRAAEVFATLKMHKTEQRNGVLFYLSITDHKFAILGDAGINQKTVDDYWDNIKEAMLELLKNNDISGALERGILMAGEQLKEHFPHQQNDQNELSDEISFGK